MTPKVSHKAGGEERFRYQIRGFEHKESYAKD